MFIPETTLRPGVLGLELTSLTSVSSEVLPTPEQLSSSCRRSSCFRSAASAHEKTGGGKISLMKMATRIWTYSRKIAVMIVFCTTFFCTHGKRKQQKKQIKHTWSCLITANPNNKASIANSVATQRSSWVEPWGSTLLAVLICMLVSNNVLLKCSSECSFLLPSHETSALLEARLRSRHYREQQGRQTEPKKKKSNQGTHACHFCTAHIEMVYYFN